MGRWQDIKELTKKDESIYTRVSMIYQQYKFPVDVREHFSDWFEHQEWFREVEIDENQLDADPEICRHAETLFSGLLDQMRQKYNDTKDLVLKINLNQSRNALAERFNSSPLEFLITVRRCMDAEILLVDSMQEHEEMNHGETVNADTEQKKQFQAKVDQLINSIDNELKPLVQMVDRDVEQMKHKHNKFLIEDREKNMKVQELQHLVSLDGRSQETAKIELEKLLKARSEEQQKVITLQMETSKHSNEAAESLAGVIKQDWDLLDVWLTQQRLEMSCLTPAPDGGHLDALDNIFKMTNEQFLRVMQLQDRIQDEFDRVVIQNPKFSDKNRELTANLKIILEKHIDRMFVVERQPQRIMKITSRKSLTFNMIVRMLGGEPLGIHLNAPRVYARIFPEKDGKLQHAVEYQGRHDIPEEIPKGIAEVGNGASIFEKQRSTGNLLAVFSSYQLRKVERICNERIAKEERVTDQKYAMVYYTKVRVMNQDFHKKVISLPICLNTSNSQEGPSKGTLIWEAAFPIKDREPWSFADHDQVLFPEVVKVINALFERQTDKPLTAEQLGYLAERLMGVKFGSDTSLMMVSKDKFLKENLPHCNFTFWKWVFACLNLIRMKLKSEWRDGLIFGFIGRPLTKALLKDKPQGTFLLRFSDTSIEDTQSSEVPGCLTVAVVHENPKKLGSNKEFYVKKHLHSDEINKHGLANILQAFVVKDPRHPDQNIAMAKNLLLPYDTVDPVKPIEAVFKDYIVEKVGQYFVEEKKDGYAKTVMKIEVDLEDQEDTKDVQAESIYSQRNVPDGYSSPQSIYSATTVGVSSPNPSDLATDIDMMGIVNSPCTSDANSQALSPQILVPDDADLNEAHLTPHDEDQILQWVEANNFDLNTSTSSQLISELTGSSRTVSTTLSQVQPFLPSVVAQVNQTNQSESFPIREVVQQVLDNTEIK